MRKVKNRPLIGFNEFKGECLVLPNEFRENLIHNLEKNRADTSKLIEDMIKLNIYNDKSLLDTNETLYKSIVDYLEQKRQDKKVILIDPNDKEWASTQDK